MRTIKDILEYAGIDTSKRIKIARHKDKRVGVNLEELIETGYFQLYQSYQEKNVFKDCDYLVSCVGIKQNQAMLLGVYKVNGTYPINGLPEKYKGYFGEEAKKESKYRYDLEKLKGFEEYENRLIIQWDSNSRGWYRKLETSNNKIIQWLPKGYVSEFPGYDDVILSYGELEKIVGNPISNKLWHDMLSSVKGIYLILDRKEGTQYVGSASGQNGIIGRWSDYTKGGHGGNKRLIEIVDKDPNRKYDFQFCILRVLSPVMSTAEVIAEEIKYKRKLGTRVFGLNPF